MSLNLIEFECICCNPDAVDSLVEGKPVLCRMVAFEPLYLHTGYGQKVTDFYVVTLQLLEECDNS